ncbi:lysozyme C-like [Rhineura floridana]|uniref:lysozyme C-like n=1 Tax=Rhineura floridana TaxID=261503 RepID=UPI002AC850C8|nr:lysozyme C-like [Rhineura floridana]
MCVLGGEDSFNTNPIVSSTGLRRYYGLFRIDNENWCSDGRIESRNYCGISCNQLLDDNLLDDIACVRIMLKSRIQIQTWTTWRTRCRTKKYFNYLSDCGF